MLRKGNEGKPHHGVFEECPNDRDARAAKELKVFRTIPDSRNRSSRCANEPSTRAGEGTEAHCSRPRGGGRLLLSPVVLAMGAGRHYQASVAGSRLTAATAQNFCP